MSLSALASPLSIPRLLLLSCVVLLSACTYSTGDSNLGAPQASIPFGDDEPLDTATSVPATSTPDTAAADTVPAAPTTTTVDRQSCVGWNFSINYPDSWYAGGPEGREDHCLWLSRRSLQAISSDDFVPEISFTFTRHYGDALKSVSAFEDNDTVLINSTATNINSFPATMFDVEASGRSGVADGSRSRIVVIDLDGKALIATATEATTADPGIFDDTTAVLGEVLDSLYPIG